MAANVLQRIRQKMTAIWRGAAIGLSLLCLSLAVWLWYSAKQETVSAFENGRRLVIRLDDGTISGKVVSTTDDKTAAVAPTVLPAEGSQAAAAAADTTATKPADKPGDKPAAATPVAQIVLSNPVDAPKLAAVDLPPATIVPADQMMADVNKALIEKTTNALVPIIGKDGTKPWRYYSKPFMHKEKQPMIAVIITGLGQNKNVAEIATRLPPEITLSLNPYAPDLASWGAAIRATGHEILVDLPMEPANYPASDPGPHGLMGNKPPEVNEANLQWAMSRFPVFVGLLTPQSEVFSSSGDAFKLLLQSMANRGLMLVVGSEPAKKETSDTIETSNTAVIVADLLIDEDLSESAIQTRLTSLEELAKKRGYAVGIAQGFPLTMEQLKAWSATLAAKGIILAPVSSIAKLKFS